MWASIKAQKRLLLIGLALVLAIAGLIIWRYYKNQANPSFGKNTVSSSSLATKQTQAANQSLAQKNYPEAVNSYYIAAAAASSAGDNLKAKAVLEECIAKVPDKEVPYIIYDSLASVAAALNDNKLEKNSLGKALSKAQNPESGATSDLINFYKDQLAKMGN